MNEIISADNLENIIYEIRGLQVMLSSDVAKLYNEETRRVNEVIKRNIKRFPESFCFQLTGKEYENLRSQFATSSLNNYGGTRYLPYVLTEQGIMMLSGLLKSAIAVRVNIQIIEAFVKMRHHIKDHIDYLPNRVLLLEDKHDRFIIIDNKLLYVCGSSFKNIGKKCFFISEVDNKEYLNQIIMEVNNEWFDKER